MFFTLHKKTALYINFDPGLQLQFHFGEVLLLYVGYQVGGCFDVGANGDINISQKNIEMRFKKEKCIH